jgi:hypothetical protein
MKTVAGACIIAVVLVLAGAVCLSEARVMRRLAADRQRLATLQYEAESSAESTTPLVDRLQLPVSSTSSAESQRATAQYWQGRYEVLTPLTGATGEAATTDPALLLIAANATFRTSAPDPGNTRGSVDRLESVVQAYGDVLRADPDNVDAAYNYEYVSRMRDALARGRFVMRGSDRRVALSDDLPVGPTVHGRPGGPPPEVPMTDFKTFMPLQSDERGDLMNRDRTPVPRGKG